MSSLFPCSCISCRYRDVEITDYPCRECIPIGASFTHYQLPGTICASCESLKAEIKLLKEHLKSLDPGWYPADTERGYCEYI
jgi:hypothetical protein